MTPRGHWVEHGLTFEIEVEGETFRLSLKLLAIAEVAPSLAIEGMSHRERQALYYAVCHSREPSGAASTMHAIKPDGRRELVPFQLRLPRLTWRDMVRRWWLRFGRIRDNIPTARALPPRRRANLLPAPAQEIDHGTR